MDGDDLSLVAPSDFHRRWVADRYLGAIEQAAHAVFGPAIKVSLTSNHTAPLENLSVVIDDTDPAVPAGLPTAAVPPPGAGLPPLTQDYESSLIGKYTFDNFVVGPSNRFAHAACMAVGEKASSHYNPLFIYGPAGLGKTHLLHAVGHHRKEMEPVATLRYVTSEQFFNEFINGIRQKRMEEFKARYRTIDVLMIDDVQFFEGKEQILEEFFHTFNHLYGAGKQIVLSSDRHPKHLSTLEDRIRSRFEWGLVTDIQPPDVETRLAILRKNAEFAPRSVPPDVLQFIAENVADNIRELEGALTRVTAYAALTHERITLQMAREVLQDLLPGSASERVTAEQIIQKTAAVANVTEAHLIGPSRKQPLARWRQIAMYLCRELTDLSLPKIGAHFGGRDHTTVIHAIDKIKGLMAADKQVFDEVTALSQQLRRT